jgi:hypothetical protein
LYGSASGSSVPEPDSLVLFGSGLLTVVGVVRHKQFLSLRRVTKVRSRGRLRKTS